MIIELLRVWYYVTPVESGYNEKKNGIEHVTILSQEKITMFSFFYLKWTKILF